MVRVRRVRIHADVRASGDVVGGEREAARGHDAEEVEPRGGKDAKGFFDNGLEVGALLCLAEGDGLARADAGGGELFAEFGEGRGVTEEVVHAGGEGDAGCFAAGGDVIEDMEVHVWVGEGGVAAGFGEEGGHEVCFEGVAACGCLFVGFLFELAAFRVPFVDAARGERHNVGEASFAGWGEDLEEVKDRFVQSGEVAHDGTVACVGVDYG